MSIKEHARTSLHPTRNVLSSAGVDVDSVPAEAEQPEGPRTAEYDVASGGNSKLPMCAAGVPFLCQARSAKLESRPLSTA